MWKEEKKLLRSDFDFQNAFAIVGINSINEMYLRKTLEKEYGDSRLKCTRIRFEKTKNIYLQDEYKKMCYRLNYLNNRLRDLKKSDKTSEILSTDEEEQIQLKLDEIDEMDSIIEEMRELEEKSKPYKERISAITAPIDERIKQIESKKQSVFKTADSMKNPEERIYYIAFELIQLRLSKMYELNFQKKSDSVEERAEKKKNREIARNLMLMFSSPSSIKEYVEESLLVYQNVDFENRDLSRFAYKPAPNNRNKYLYAMRFEGRTPILQSDLVPREIFAYDFGRFQFKTPLAGDNVDQTSSCYYSTEYSLIGVIRRDEDGAFKKYHGIIYQRVADILPEFYANVAFSNMVLRNATKNNFGYIGDIEKAENTDYGSMLVFNPLDIDKLIGAISYALENRGICKFSGIQTLSDAYEYIDRSLDRILRTELNNLPRIRRSFELPEQNQGKIPGGDD